MNTVEDYYKPIEKQHTELVKYVQLLQERNAKLEEDKKELSNILVGNNLEFQNKELECYQLQSQVDKTTEGEHTFK